MQERKPHKHAEVIKAWADGAIVQCKFENDDNWITIVNTPEWLVGVDYRVKPEPKPDLIVNCLMEFPTPWNTPKMRISWNGDCIPAGYLHNIGRYPLIRYTFDGESNTLKSVEIVK